MSETKALETLLSATVGRTTLSWKYAEERAEYELLRAKAALADEIVQSVDRVYDAMVVGQEPENAIDMEDWLRRYESLTKKDPTDGR